MNNNCNLKYSCVSQLKLFNYSWIGIDVKKLAHIGCYEIDTQKTILQQAIILTEHSKKRQTDSNHSELLKRWKTRWNNFLFEIPMPIMHLCSYQYNENTRCTEALMWSANSYSSFTIVNVEIMNRSIQTIGCESYSSTLCSINDWLTRPFNAKLVSPLHQSQVELALTTACVIFVHLNNNLANLMRITCTSLYLILFLSVNDTIKITKNSWFGSLLRAAG